MSTSLLYHAFCIRGYKFVRAFFNYGRIVFRVRQERHHLRCPVCRSRRINLKGSINRTFRSAPIVFKPVFIEFAIPRIECLDCGAIRQVKLGFADERRSYTRQFERLALGLCRHMTIKDVANFLGVSWDMIKEIQKRYLKRRFSRPSLKGIKRLAIDEIYIGSKEKYLTIVMDLSRGAVVFVGEGKGGEALIPFWRRLKRANAHIEAVAIDMSAAYIAAVRDNLPKAVIVFDHFHIIKLYNDGLTKLRRELYHQCGSQEEKQVIKGTRWLLLKNPDKLDDTRDEPDRLKQALEINQPLAAAYYMKEDLRLVWDQPDKETAENFLIDWLWRAGRSGISMLIKMAHTIGAHRPRILSYYDYPISTGPLEGTNNKIKTVKRQAYGYRDQEFFILKIMSLHTTRYALVG